MSQSATEERYVFECEWFDQQADLIRKYLITYFPRNHTIEMVTISKVKFNLIAYALFSLILRRGRYS